MGAGPRRTTNAAAGASGAADIVFHNFNDGTDGGSWDDLGDAAISYPDDPTGSGRGKVCRFLYAPFAGDPGSNDVNVVKSTTHHYRYGETLWFKGDVYFPSAVVTGGPQNYNNTRKFIDFFQAPPNCRLIIERSFGSLTYFVCQIEDDNAFHTDITIGNTGTTLLDDTWYTIEIKLKLNSADRVKDGVLEIYVNNSTATPTFSLTSGIQMISEGSASGTADQQTLFAAGGSYLNSFRFGTQLTIHFPTDPQYTQYRYWDNVGLSTTRIA